MENRSISPPSPPRSPNPPNQLNQLYPTGARTLRMSSWRKPMINFPLIIPTTMLSNFAHISLPKLPRSIPSTQQSWKHANSLLKNTSRQDKLYPQNLPKPHLSSSYQRRMEFFAHAKITATWTPTPSRMPIPSPSSLNSLTIWRNLPCSLNFTFDGDITTFASRRKTNGKLLLSPPWDSSNPLSCSSDSATLPPPFKLSWTISSQICFQKSG